MRSATLRNLLLGATAVVAACSGDDATPVESTPAAPRLIVVLSSQVDTVPEATSKPLIARVTDLSGVLKSAPITWHSSNPAVASVAAGMVTGVAVGTTDVIASIGTAADTARIVVTQNDLSLDVQPAAAAVVLGDTLQFTATVRTRSGDIVAVNRFTWTSSDTNAASILSPGNVQTKKEGDVAISAEALARRGWSALKIFRSPVAYVSLSPSTANVYVDDELELDVTLRDLWGRVVDANVSWGSSNYLKASVDQEGVVIGKSAGTVVITATAGSKTGSATINVLNRPATSLTLAIPSDTALIGVDLQATAIPMSSSGQPMEGRTIAWQSANPGVATVSSAGVIKGIVEGSTNISAISDGIVATKRVSVRSRRPSSITILPGAPSIMAGQASQLSARVDDQLGNEMSAPVSWSSNNSSVATVSSSGLVTAIAPGTAAITVATGSLSASVPATVASVPVSSVQVAPAVSTMTVGEETVLTATARDASGAILPGRVASWFSLHPAIATVSPTGQVSAIAPGTATIRGTIEGVSANASITVNAPAPTPVASILVSLSTASLEVGQTAQASAILKDSKGNVLSGRPITWSSLDPAVASVSSDGAVTAKSGGTIAIVAQSEGVTGSASVTVNAPAPASVAQVLVSVPTDEIFVGESVQSTVTLKDAQGNVLSGRTITYSTDNPTVVSVSATGLVTAIGAGSTALRVTSGGISGSVMMYVGPAKTPPSSPVLTTINVSGSQALVVGQTAQATAATFDQNGKPMQASVTWTTSKPSVATVSSNGTITAIGAGTATVAASASGVTGSLTVTVSNPTPTAAASVTVSLNPGSILVGQTAQATAIVKDAQGNVMTGKIVTWSVATGALVAQVSSGGIVTGVAAGITPISASVDGISGSAQLTVSDPAPPPSGGSTVAELPRTYLNFPYPAKTGQTIVVPAGGNLQSALNSAQRGDEIVLTAGATYTGNFTLPAKSGTAANGWITIRSDKFSQLPAIGTRVTSAHASLMPKIVTPNVSAAIQTASGTSGWRLVGLEVTVAASVTIQQYGLVWLGTTGSAQSTLASVPSDIVLDRMYIHGLTTTNTSRCVAMNSARTQISDSYLVECHGKGFDSQAIWGGNGPGPFKIVNNTLSGAGENIMFGGDDPAIPGLVPSDIEIRQNYIYTPAAWKGVWSKKNLFELKNASRVLVEGNVFDGSWTDGQTGWAVIMKSANQSGGCRWCRTTDVTFRRNLIMNAGAGINVAARDDNPNTDTTARRIAIIDNVLEKIYTGIYTGDRRGFQLLGGTADVTLERNVLAGGTITAVWLDWADGGTKRPILRDNVWVHGAYGVMASDYGAGLSSLTAAAPGYTWSNIIFVGGQEIGVKYPAGTSYVTSEAQAPLAGQIRSLVTQATAGVVIP